MFRLSAPPALSPSALLVPALLAAGVFAMPAMAAEPSPAMQQFLETRILPLASDPEIAAAAAAQNARTVALSSGRIAELDAEWAAQMGAASQPLIEEVTGSDLAAELRRIVEESQGAITEIIVFDARGLNVAASAVTSDYWQGDEAKYSETYPKGPRATHFSEVEFDESSQSYQAQVSVTLTDPASGAPVGAMTVGINADLLL